MELPLSEKYTILERLPGHVPLMGKSAGEELNWAYHLKNKETSEECIAMFCKPNHLTFIDEEVWQKLHNTSITWYFAPVGYIMRTVKKDDEFSYTYLHQFVKEHCGYGKGQQSIDHENQNKLDNRKVNLRIVDMSEQNRNRGKVSRHANARELPKEFDGVTLPKFCVYYKECYNKEKNMWREFFTIEGHPKQEGKRKATTKSSKKTIIEKFEEANLILAELDNI
jgi:hypothetical protein